MSVAKNNKNMPEIPRFNQDTLRGLYNDTSQDELVRAPLLA